MSKKQKEDKNEEVTQVGEDVKVEQTEFSVPKGSIIDKAVTVISLDKDPYHKDGDEFQMAEKTAKLLEEKGWVKIKK